MFYWMCNRRARNAILPKEKNKLVPGHWPLSSNVTDPANETCHSAEEEAVDDLISKMTSATLGQALRVRPPLWPSGSPSNWVKQCACLLFVYDFVSDICVARQLTNKCHWILFLMSARVGLLEAPPRAVVFSLSDVGQMGANSAPNQPASSYLSPAADFMKCLLDKITKLSLCDSSR